MLKILPSQRQTSQKPKRFLHPVLLSCYMLTSSFLSRYASWKFILYVVFYLIIFTTVGNVVSVLDESVLFMIIGVFLTGKSVGLYCLKFLWCYSIHPLWSWTFTMLLWSLFFFSTTPYGSFWKFFPLILEFPGSVLNSLSYVCRCFLHHQVCLDPISIIPKFTFPTRALPWVQTQWTFPFGCPQSR